ncbi:hypothetical protein [Variovorax sp. PAMC 28711]|uniref:hypothetical protein n=1 Tax=Variovorax sp. PAMC 28711 TaxID=1795631 RepID=UPI00078C20A4|nr:hypothetical protein [Variovorax sp. PAMC 28711]AMM23731.1 hypothetical protein AX767_04775 [Variovorax sp. PAMC 28711]
MNPPSRSGTARALTEREAFAGVLASLVHQRCIATQTQKTSRTGLQLTVPVNERPYVRRGLDALIDQGVLVMTGEDIGFTPQGHVLMTFIANVHDHPNTVAEDVAGHPVLTPLFKAIALDERLEPPRSMDEIRTLPARLENYRGRRKTSGVKRLVMVLGGAGVVAVGFMLMR